VRKKQAKKIIVLFQKVTAIINLIILFYFVACYVDIVANNTAPRRAVGVVERCSKCKGGRLP
jgi:hypothetical protein